MGDPEFSVDSSERGLFKLAGELDIAGGERLSQAVVSLNGDAVEIDLSGLTFVDSSGLRTLFKIRRDQHGVRYVRPSSRGSSR